MYQFAENADDETRSFWGENRGMPMNKPSSHGMLDGTRNVLSYPCKEINRSVPYFENLEKDDMSINQYLHSTILKMHEQSINMNDKNAYIKHSEELPDGAVTVE